MKPALGSLAPDLTTSWHLIRPCHRNFLGRWILIGRTLIHSLPSPRLRLLLARRWQLLLGGPTHARMHVAGTVQPHPTARRSLQRRRRAAAASCTPCSPTPLQRRDAMAIPLLAAIVWCQLATPTNMNEAAP
jgi:hypothetical protein